MACENCEFKGYVESFIAKDARMKPMIAQCPKCKDTAAYSKRVKEMMAGGDPAPAPKAPFSGGNKVLQFPTKPKEKT